MEVVFREIVKKDLIEVWELLEQLKPISEIQPEWFEPDVDDAWTEYNSIGIVGIYEGKIIAFGSIIIENKIRGYRSCHLEDIVVDEEYRSKGVGTLLMDYINKKAEKNGCYRVTLFCREGLIPFYEKAGYEVNNVVMKQWFEIKKI